MRVAILIGACVLLVGCATNSTTTRPPTTLEPEATNASPTPETTPENTTRPSPTPSNSAMPCEDVMFQRAQGTIRAQQDALAAADFEAARAYASDNFRSGVSVGQFQAIIEGNYSFLLNDPAITFVDCQRRGDSALIRVEVEGSPITIMLYGVVLENESWFIDAASIAGTREPITA